jgi:hypothetical protein
VIENWTLGMQNGSGFIVSPLGLVRGTGPLSNHLGSRAPFAPQSDWWTASRAPSSPALLPRSTGVPRSTGGEGSEIAYSG